MVNMRARLKIADSIFDHNTAIDGQGGAVSIDTSTDVVLDRVHCEENRANHKLTKLGHGGCLSVTSDAEEGLPPRVVNGSPPAVIRDSVRRRRVRRTELRHDNDRVVCLGAKGSGAVYVSSAKVTLSTLSVKNTSCASTTMAPCVRGTLQTNKK